MRFLPDGTVEIKNKAGGETKIVRPEDLPNYGISYDTYNTQKKAYSESVGGVSEAVKKVQDSEKQKSIVSAQAARDTLEVLNKRARGEIAGNQADDALNFAASEYNSKRAFGEGGKSLTDTERQLLSGQLIDTTVKNPNVLQRAAGWITGQEPQTKSYVSEDEASIRNKLVEAVLKSDPTADVSQYMQPAGNLKAKEEAMSIGGLFKNAGQDAVDFAINNPINTAKKVAGVGFEGTRAAMLGGTENDTNQIIQESALVNNQLRNETDPVKKQALINRSRELSGMLEGNSTDLARQTETQNPFVDVNSIPNTPLDVAKDVAVSTGASLGIKPGENGLEFDPGLAVRSAYERPVTTGLMAAEGFKVGKNLIQKKGGLPNIEEGPIKSAKTLTRETLPNIDQTPKVLTAEEYIAKSGKLPKDIKRASNEFLVDNELEVPAKIAYKIKPQEVAKEFIANGHGNVRGVEALRELTNQVTGDTGLSTQVTRNAVASMKNEIKLLDDAGSNPVSKAVADNLKIAHDVPKDIRPDVIMEVQSVLDTAQGSLPDTYDPAKLFDVQRALEKKAANSAAKSTYLSKNPQAEALAKVYKDAANEIGSYIQKSADEQGVVANSITPEIIAQAQAISPRYAEQLSRAAQTNKLSEVRSSAAPYVKMGQILDLTDAGSLSAFKNASRKFSGIGEKIGSLAGTPGRLAGKAVDMLGGEKLGRQVMYASQDLKQGLPNIPQKMKKL